MKLKANYILREIMDECILIPVGATAVEDKSITIMTETGGIIVMELQKGSTKEAILDLILNEYEVSREEAEKDFDEFIDMLRQNDLIEE